MSVEAAFSSPSKLELRDSPQVARNALADGFAVRIGRWAEQTGATPVDISFLTHAARELALAACDGHVCLPLRELSGTTPQAARHALLASGAAIEAGSRMLPAAAWPLVIDGERLYLRYFFDLETRLAASLAALSAAPPADAVPVERMRAVLDARFPPRPDAGPDWQKVAAALAFNRRLTIISGGPGTGKTTTVAAFIACLLELEPELRIALAAPTGKAAARMREAMAARARGLPESVRAKLPGEAHTIHRLLGATPEQGHFRHHAANPLALDLLVVDEASMLDLALAAALLDALPAHARLVLLGDKDQLAAVEAGAVFADLSAGWRFGEASAARLALLTGAPAGTLTQGSGEGQGATLIDSVVWLTESHRFRADSGIGRLAREINAGGGASALGWLKTSADPDVVWIGCEGIQSGAAGDAAAHEPRSWPSAAALTAMENAYAAYFAALRETPSGEPPSVRVARVFAAFERFRVLVAVHSGPCGLAAINAHLSAHARAALGLDLAAGPFWDGRPVIVLKNDPVTRLFNGDIGLCLNDAGGATRVYFPVADGGHRSLPPQRLPEHDTALALTVHKSQGSEFAEILLLLPGRPSRVLSRELLYTAITRATQRVTIAGVEPVFVAACAARGERFSGLGDKLLGQNL
ncbi:MAG: exodeoxyribonuclease V subunit alpha [Azoarcus sp.]|jgi:exodeoxyribonuclease V alpha subunit|nr:exodeoxyribonuclease V subunit alpha [Azoarcus sp.]